MTCFHPRYGYRDTRGKIRFERLGSQAWRSPIVTGCGQCIGCTNEHKRQLGIRCFHELQTTPETKACFLTLTQDDDHLIDEDDPNPNVRKDVWQKFAKKLRHRGKFRFLSCGEYGDEKERPHYHAIIFGHDFREDRILFKRNERGDPIYTSKELDEIWTRGHATVAAAELDSMNYVAGYVQKKVRGKGAHAHYERLNKITGELYQQTPEFGLMSRGDNSGDPNTGYGLGHAWIEKYYAEVYPWDQVVINGQPQPVPKYYDRWYEEHYPLKWEFVKYNRKLKHLARNPYENCPEKLKKKKKIFTSKNRAYNKGN